MLVWRPDNYHVPNWGPMKKTPKERKAQWQRDRRAALKANRPDWTWITLQVGPTAPRTAPTTASAGCAGALPPSPPASPIEVELADENPQIEDGMEQGVHFEQLLPAVLIFILDEHPSNNDRLNCWSAIRPCSRACAEIFTGELQRRRAWPGIVRDIVTKQAVRRRAGSKRRLQEARLAGKQSRDRLLGRCVRVERVMCDNSGNPVQVDAQLQVEVVPGRVTHVTQPGSPRDWVTGAGGEIEIRLDDEDKPRVVPIVRGGVNLFDFACVCMVSGLASCRFHSKLGLGTAAVPKYEFY